MTPSQAQPVNPVLNDLTIHLTWPGENSPRALTREDLRKELARREIAEYGEVMKRHLFQGRLEGHQSTSPDPQCPGCGGTGYYSLKIADHEDSRFGKLFHCECTAGARSARLQSISGLTPSERLVSLDDIEPTGGMTDLIVDVARSFVKKPSKLLTIWGGSGNAKTLILQGIVNACAERHIEAVYIEMKDLADYVRALHQGRDGQEDAYQFIKRLKAVPVLAIDEFDKLKVTEWYEEFETALMSKRYRDALDGLSGTVLAMNSDPANLPEHIYSRLADGRNLILHNTDPDLRSLMADA